MSRIEMGTIKEGYETYMITKGFDISYEIVETESGVTNTYDSLEEFAEMVLVLTKPIAYYSLLHITRELVDVCPNWEKICRDNGLESEEIEYLERR